MDRTFIAIKPDGNTAIASTPVLMSFVGVQRGLVAEIISRFEKKGFILVRENIAGLLLTFVCRSASSWRSAAALLLRSTTPSTRASPSMRVSSSSSPAAPPSLWSGRVRCCSLHFASRRSCFSGLSHSRYAGKGVVEAGRKLIGATKPLESAPGTIRGDFGIDVGRNIIHGSDSVESAKREIGLWFKTEELVSWRPTNIVHIYEKQP